MEFDMLADKEEAKLADMVTGYGGWAQTFSTQTLLACASYKLCEFIRKAPRKRPSHMFGHCQYKRSKLQWQQSSRFQDATNSLSNWMSEYLFSDFYILMYMPMELEFSFKNLCYEPSSSIWNAHQSWLETWGGRRPTLFSNWVTKDLVRCIYLFFDSHGGVCATIKVSYLYHKFKPREIFLPNSPIGSFSQKIMK